MCDVGPTKSIVVQDVRARLLVFVHIIVEVILACHIHHMICLSLRLLLLLLFKMVVYLEIYVVKNEAL